jgi:hypothetical protein
MQRNKWTTSIVVALALTGVSLGEGVVRKDLRFKVGKHPVVSVNSQYGPITVRAGAARVVLVTAILHSDKVELDQSKSGNRIGLISHLLPGADGTTGIVEYEIQVPAGSDLTLQSETGPIHVEKLRGDVTIEGSNAPIDVVDCADGHVHVKTLDGAVNLTNIHNGHVEIVSMGGDVTMNAVSGPLVKVNSNSGKIQYDGDFGAEGDYDFSSHTGNIEAIAPAYASIDVLARSSNGPVQSDFSLEPKHTPFVAAVGSAFAGTWNKAASSVSLFSFSGRIHLKKRQN